MVLFQVIRHKIAHMAAEVETLQVFDSEVLDS